MDIYDFLTEHMIAYERIDHPPVYTVDDVHRLTPDLPGSKTKNLFLRDKKGMRHFLVVMPADKRIDLKALPEVLASSKVSFGSPARLMKHLGVEPGSVSLLAILNDTEIVVEVFIDEALWNSDAFQFHPLVNTSTLVLSKAGIESFLKALGHAFQIVNIPSPS
jgi:Ala-tRNA(Pro) deacylase